MGYLEKFAKNRRPKEKTEVLTARIPTSVYKKFQSYCEELGLSISEAVNLLVYRELESSEQDSKPAKNTEVYKSNDNVVETNTEASLPVVEQDSQVNTNVVKTNTNVDKPKQTTKGNTERFTTKPWQVDGELPCPLCEEWFSASNFSRHAKQHGSNVHAIFTNETYQKKINEMIFLKTSIFSKGK